MTSERRLSDAARMGPVHLRVRDAPPLVDFYTRALGFSVLEQAGRVTLGADRPLLVLHPDPDAPPRPVGAAGLYHVAYLLPTRADLARALRRFSASGVPLDGAADHAVSEALYLQDPEGNGIEIYADRPREAWGWEDGRVGMATRALDARGLLAQAEGVWGGLPAGTRVGHVHLQVDDVRAAERFYRDVVGFELTARYGAEASFYAAGRYHHHVATNRWGVRAPARDGALGLLRASVELPDEAARDALETRLTNGGIAFTRQGGAIFARDPAGNALAFVVA